MGQVIRLSKMYLSNLIGHIVSDWKVEALGRPSYCTCHLRSCRRRKRHRYHWQNILFDGYFLNNRIQFIYIKVNRHEPKHMNTNRSKAIPKRNPWDPFQQKLSKYLLERFIGESKLWVDIDRRSASIGHFLYII